MRYKINFLIRQLLRQHYKKLSATSIRTNLNNLIYANKSISKHQLDILIRIAKTSKRFLRLKEAKFYPELNFGRYLNPIEIRFRGKSLDFAEFIGIMLGDGNIYQNAIRVTINSEEQDYKKHIGCLFKRLFSVQPKLYPSKVSKSLSVYVYSKELRELLEKYGLNQGNKVKRNVKVPGWIKNYKRFSRHCIKGMIDTDGCLHYHKRDKQLYISYSSRASNLLKDLQRMAKYFNLNFTQNNSYTVTLYKKEEVRTYIKEIGFSNKRHSSKVRLYLGL